MSYRGRGRGRARRPGRWVEHRTVHPAECFGSEVGEAAIDPPVADDDDPFGGDVFGVGVAIAVRAATEGTQLATGIPDRMISRYAIFDIGIQFPSPGSFSCLSKNG